MDDVLDTERKSLHISDGTKKTAFIETLTVENGAEVTTLQDVVRYQYDNHLGSSCLELDESAATISYEEYHPFGTSSYRLHRNDSEASLKRYRYVGKEHDEETGLYYYGARYYAAHIARFVSVDPLQHKYPELTPYQYASNRPISGIDLDGLEYVEFEITLDGDFNPISVEMTNDYRNLTDEEIESIHGVTADEFKKKFSATYGSKGRGIKYTYVQGDKKVTKWEMRQEGMGSRTKYHGIYSGPGGMSTLIETNLLSLVRHSLRWR